MQAPKQWRWHIFISTCIIFQQACETLYHIPSFFELGSFYKLQIKAEN